MNPKEYVNMQREYYDAKERMKEKHKDELNRLEQNYKTLLHNIVFRKEKN